ncbi:MAG TPA: DUF4390 domain-containing protein [Burkholderiales bacterium]|nr:DUF4390 domain-containing protein [Burkholderiales bacterium]
MPVWRSNRRALVATAALLVAASAIRADFKVTELQTRLHDGVLVVSGSMQLELSRKVEEALSKGIELPVLIETRLYRKRALLWDETIEAWTVRRNLGYHALSGQYIVNAGTGTDSFLSPADALRHLGTLTELRLRLPEVDMAQGDEYVVKLRARIDIEALPAPLRPVAYTTLSWHMNTGWTTWNVQR